jgi:uncharacterized membrane protein
LAAASWARCSPPCPGSSTSCRWLDDRDVRRVGLMHMVINLAAVGLFTLNFFMRRSQPDHGGPWWLTLLGVGLISASGWLGGEMVHRYGVSVEAGAGPTRT